MLFYGTEQGAFGTVFPFFLSEIFGAEHFSKLYGTILLFQAIGFSIGSVLLGKISDSTGSYAFALQMAVAISCICLFATTAIRQPRGELVVQVEEM